MSLQWGVVSLQWGEGCCVFAVGQVFLVKWGEGVVSLVQWGEGCCVFGAVGQVFLVKWGEGVVSLVQWGEGCCVFGAVEEGCCVFMQWVRGVFGAEGCCDLAVG